MIPTPGQTKWTIKGRVTSKAPLQLARTWPRCVIWQLDSKILHIQGELSSSEAEMGRARPMRCRASSSLGIRPGEVFHVELLDAEGGSGGQGGGVDMR